MYTFNCPFEICAAHFEDESSGSEGGDDAGPAGAHADVEDDSLHSFEGHEGMWETSGWYAMIWGQEGEFACISYSCMGTVVCVCVVCVYVCVCARACTSFSRHCLCSSLSIE